MGDDSTTPKQKYTGQRAGFEVRSGRYTVRQNIASRTNGGAASEEGRMKSIQSTSNGRKGTMVLGAILAAMCIPGISNAAGRHCSNATLEGGYGFFVQTVVLPAGTPRAILGRF